MLEYHLLEPLLPELDVFFTSWDEARMIRATLDGTEDRTLPLEKAVPDFLAWLVDRFAVGDRTQLLGVTVRDGAFAAYCTQDHTHVRRVVSPFQADGVVDLVGAGDAFRAGLIGYLAQHTAPFRQGKLDVEEAVQVGNLMASTFIQAPLSDRYDGIPDMEQLVATVREARR